MYHPYYIPLFRANLNLPYKYENPYQQYNTDPWHITPTYDINQVANRVTSESIPSSYTYGENKNEHISRSDQSLNYAYFPTHDPVTHHYTMRGSNNNAT